MIAIVYETLHFHRVGRSSIQASAPSVLNACWAPTGLSKLLGTESFKQRSYTRALLLTNKRDCIEKAGEVRGFSRVEGAGDHRYLYPSPSPW